MKEENPELLSEIIKSQWLLYEAEDIEKFWIMQPNAETFIRIDLFWNQIGEIRDLQGKLKYKELHNLVKACLSLSHANASPERGFSINKMMINNKESIKEDTIISLRFVKDALLSYSSIENFPVTKRIQEMHIISI